MGFTPPRDTSPPSDDAEEMDLAASTESAMREWETLRKLFEVVKSRLGSGFQPLDPEYEPPRDSPFGPVLVYRTHTVAGIWLNFYMGLIVLYRAHPSMPPVAMMAAGLSARHTAPFANEIGQIAAGISDDISGMAALSTVMAGAIMETSLPVFVAGVQVGAPLLLLEIANCLMLTDRRSIEIRPSDTG